MEELVRSGLPVPLVALSLLQAVNEKTRYNAERKISFIAKVECKIQTRGLSNQIKIKCKE